MHRRVRSVPWTDGSGLEPGRDPVPAPEQVEGVVECLAGLLEHDCRAARPRRRPRRRLDRRRRPCTGHGAQASPRARRPRPGSPSRTVSFTITSGPPPAPRLADTEKEPDGQDHPDRGSEPRLAVGVPVEDTGRRRPGVASSANPRLCAHGPAEGHQRAEGLAGRRGVAGAEDEAEPEPDTGLPHDGNQEPQDSG